jgi:predicted nuclease of predicted toxin-antitoxin system
VKLLLDENLSRRLVTFLQDAFPNSSQVTLIGLERASDLQVWEFAKAHNFVIVTNDADFAELSLLNGCPPHVIWLKGLNVNKAGVLSLLTTQVEAIRTAVELEGRACVEIVKK